MSELLIEITDNSNPDLHAFLFCAEVLVKENKDQRKHVTRLIIQDGCVYVTNGKTARSHILNNDYKNGYYRVFRKDKDDVILHFDGNDDAPNFKEILNHDNLKSLGEVTVDEDFFPAHAEITLLTETVFRAEFLKKAVGTYHVFKRDKFLVLDDGYSSIGIAPIQTQTTIPGV